MEDKLKNLKKLVESYELLLEENRKLRQENEVLRQSLNDLENELLLCRREIKYIKELRDRALKKLEKLIQQVEDFE